MTGGGVWVVAEKRRKKGNKIPDRIGRYRRKIFYGRLKPENVSEEEEEILREREGKEKEEEEGL